MGSKNQVFFSICVPDETRTRIVSVKGRWPNQLADRNIKIKNENGGNSWYRANAYGIFSPSLYHLSYIPICHSDRTRTYTHAHHTRRTPIYATTETHCW